MNCFLISVPLWYDIEERYSSRYIDISAPLNVELQQSSVLVEEESVEHCHNEHNIVNVSLYQTMLRNTAKTDISKLITNKELYQH